MYQMRLGEIINPLAMRFSLPVLIVQLELIQVSEMLISNVIYLMFLSVKD